MTESSESGGLGAYDSELDRRAKIFHEKLAVLETYDGNPPWDVLCDTALASHFLYDAKRRAPEPDVWERAISFVNLITLAKGGETQGGTIEIGHDAAQEMIFRATEDPDYFERLKDFCGYALSSEPMPNSGETTFKLHFLLSRWIGLVATKEIRRPKTRKRQVSASKIVNKAIADTVQLLHDKGVPIFKNDESTTFSVNACDAVSEVFGEALGRKPITGRAVQKIYYMSDWSEHRKIWSQSNVE